METELKHKKLLEVSKEGVIANFLVRVLADQIEILSLFAEKELGKAGLEFSKRDKILLNQIKYAAIDLRKTIRGTSERSQIDFGETTDDLFKVLMLTFDRAGENKSKYDMIVRFIESINSEENLNLKMFRI